MNPGERRPALLESALGATPHEFESSYSGRTSPADLYQRLRSAPRGATGQQGAASAQVTRALAAVLTSLNTQIKALEAQIAAQLAAHADGHIFTSLPRSGTIRTTISGL